MAMKRYSKDKPRVVIEDNAGDGGFDYDLTLLADWSEGFSAIRQVEYPVDDTDETLDTLDDDKWMIYEKPSGKVLRFLEDKPATTESIRITYTALHTCTFTACTVDAFDEEAVQALAAAMFCDMIATWYAQNADPTIEVDSVDHKSQAAEYSTRANKYKKLYLNHLGAKDDKPKPACHVQDQDVNYPGGIDRLTHPRRYR